jgi:hypothetical protein
MRVEDRGASPILGPERIDHGKRGFGVERLDGARGILGRLEDDGAAARRNPKSASYWMVLRLIFHSRCYAHRAADLLTSVGRP